MNPAVQPKRTTPEEYLAREQTAPLRSQFIDGHVVAMAGASPAHNLINSNLARILGNQLLGQPCEVFFNDQRVCVDPTGMYTYPDLLVSCEPREWFKGAKHTLLNPSVIIEVLSPSTESLDRGTKLVRYQEIPSLRHCLLVAQDRHLIQCYSRDGDTWTVQNFSDLEQVVDLSAVRCVLKLAEVYEEVDLEEAERSPDLTLFEGENPEGM